MKRLLLAVILVQGFMATAQLDTQVVRLEMAPVFGKRSNVAWDVIQKVMA